MTRVPRRLAPALLALALLPAPPAGAMSKARPVSPQRLSLHPAVPTLPTAPASGTAPSLELPVPGVPSGRSPTATPAAAPPAGELAPEAVIAPAAGNAPAGKVPAAGSDDAKDGRAGIAPKVGDEKFQAALASFGEAAKEVSGGDRAAGQAALSAGFDGASALGQREAADEALDALGRDLATRGYGAMSAAPLMPSGLAGELKSSYDAWARGSPERANIQLVLYEEGGVRWGEAPGISAEAAGGARSLMEGLVSGLDRRLPGEELFIGQVELRFVKNEVPIGGFLHLDQGDYLTMTLELYPGAPGTALYDLVDGALSITETSSGQAAVLSGSMREFSTGIPATGHTGPRAPVARRITLVAHIASRSGGFRYDVGEILARGEARLAALQAALLSE